MEHSITTTLHGIIETVACAFVTTIPETWQEIILAFLNTSPLGQINLPKAFH